MKTKVFIVFLLCLGIQGLTQIVINPKGTKVQVDTSKWMTIGNNIYNKNSDNVGIGTSNPRAQFHTTRDVRFEGIGTNTVNNKILTTNDSGTVTTRLLTSLLSGNALTSLNGLSSSTQTFSTGTTGSDFNIVSSGSVHTFHFPNASSSNRGLLTSTDWSAFNAKENALTFSTGLTRTSNTISVNTSQNINTLSNLTSNGLIKTSGGTGSLSIATAGTDYSSGTSSLATGILKSTTSTGALSIAVAGDFPTLNQNTTGSAATLTTTRTIHGGSFNGSGDVTNIIASTYGGTGNGFTKFAGPLTSEKTFTLPNANATILTDNATVTVGQGGTGQSSFTDGQLLIGNSTGNTLTKSTLTAGTGISITNGGGSITITNSSPSSGGTVTSVGALTLGTTGTDLNSTVANGSTTPVITLNVPTASSTNRGALSSTDWSTFNAKENALTFSTGLTRTSNTITVNTSQNINSLSNLTSNGLIKTSGGTGALSIATAGTDYSAGTSSLATGILKSTTSTGVLSIAVAGDFPTLNQNTTGSAATLTTPRTIHGGSFNGSGDVTNIIASTYGGTGNGFAKFSGPATTEKTFTLPNANATILTDNATVTVGQGGTGQSSFTDGQLLIGNSTGNTLAKSTLTAGTGISITNGGGSITITNSSPSSGGTVTSVGALTLGTTGTDLNSTVANGSTTPVITLNVPTASSTNRGALSSTDWSTFNSKENALTFSTGLTRSTNTITVNTSQNINTLSNLTSNGLIKTSGGTGALSIATAGTDYSAGTSSLGTGILKSTTGTGALSIAVPGDFPILNQNTTGNAATVTTNANLTGDVTSVGNASTIATGVVTNAKLANMAANTIKGNNTGSSAAPTDLTATQATAMFNNFTSTLKGLTPASGGGTSNFLRADGTWAIPSGTGGTVTSISIQSLNGLGGTITNPTTTPDITLSTDVNGIVIGDGTGFSAATPGNDYSDGTASLATGILKSTTGTGALSIAVAADFPTLNQNTTGNAATSTTSSNASITDDNLTNASERIIWAAGTGSQGLKSSSTKLIFNPSTGTLSSTLFSGSGASLTNIPNSATTATSANTASTIVARDASGNFSASTINATTFNGALNGNATTVTTNANLTGPITSVGNATSVTANSITNSMLAQVPTQTFRGRTTAGTGNIEDLTLAQAKALLNLTGTNSGDQTISLTGDVTGSGTSSFAATIASGAVSYSKMQNVSATNRVLGRTSAGSGVIEEIATTGSGNVVRATSPTLVTPIGIVKGDVGLGNVDNTSDLSKPISTATQTALDLKINNTEKGANNGVATLDAGGKVPSSQLPVGSQIYKGTWNANTNTPTLADGTGTAGWTYRVVVAGTVNLGSGSITFSVGDDVIYNGTIWQRNPSSADVTSVNTLTGAVVLTTDNINEGSTNKYYTDARARASLSVSSPLTYSSSTGAFSMNQANTTTSGYLSSTDWNSFNSKQNSGNYITGLTGDVTASGPGSVAATIAANSVTYGKMQAMTANKLLGSGLTGTSVAEITLGSGLSFTGTTLNSTGTGGTVTNLSVVSANGFTGSVANPTTTPAITLTTSASGVLKGSSGALTAATAGTDYSAGTSSLVTGILKSTTGTGALSIATASDFPILNQNTTGNAATVTTNANLTGPVTSSGNATSISSNVITNAMLAQTSSQIFKGRTSAGTGNVEDLTATQATAMLNTFTSSAQGLVPASGGGTTTFLRADGTFASPTGTVYRTLVTLASDVVNNNATANTLADVTGLSFSVVAGTTYRFYAIIPYTSAATTTGSRWTINAPATTLLNYTSRYTLTATTQTVNFASAVGIPAASNANSLVSGNVAIIEGIIKPSANGTVQIRFASEIASSAITAKAGATLEYW